MALVTVIFLPLSAWGATLRVPQDYPTIQAAVDAAAPGDEILISSGSYPEEIEIEKSVTLRAAGEVQVGSSLLAGVRVRAGEVLIEGLGLAGALRVEGTAHVVLSRCTLEGTWVSGGSTLELMDCGAPFVLYAMGPAMLFARRSELAEISLMMGAQAVLENCQVVGSVQAAQASLIASDSQFEGPIDLGAASLVLSGCQVAGAVSLGPRAGAVLEDCTFVVDQIGFSLRADAQAEARACRFTGGQVAIDLSDRPSCS
ncbi:MAG TPA: hypothetical protein ENI38_04400 [Candidatus Acetothermia bacterium]|nr:hypothetical protein [Candidatus Acetothermia bacterium]